MFCRGQHHTPTLPKKLLPIKLPYVRLYSREQQASKQPTFQKVCNMDNLAKLLDAYE